MNQLVIMGHLGADPEVKFTSSGQKVTTLRMAENQRRSGKEETIWWRVTIWGEHLDRKIAHLKKGSAVIVTGEMAKPEIYHDREGNSQISLNLTAYHLNFSPFGRSDSQQREEGTFAGAKQSHMSGGNQNFGNDGTFGQREEQVLNKGQGNESLKGEQDDEIPF